MEPVFRFDEIYVVSDLHLGGEKPARQIFRQGALLADLIDSLAERPAKRSVALVINGDAVDFLAEPGAKTFDPAGAVDKLEHIFGYSEFAPVWRALRDFVSRIRRTLVIVLGNHDLELALPWVRRRLVEEISGGDDRRRGRIELAFDGSGFLCQVGQAKVLCLHGNEVDDFNLTDYDKLRELGRDGHLGHEVGPWTPNAGTKLVIDVINDVKADFAFVDLLKPEVEAVIPTVLALRPETAERAGAVLEVGARLAWDWVRRQTRFLGDVETRDRETLARQAALRSDQLLAGLAHEAFPAAGRRANDEDLERMLRDVEERLAVGAEPLDFVAADEAAQQLGWLKAGFDFVRGRETYQVVRETLEKLQRDRSFDVRTVDSPFRRLDKLVTRDVDFLVTGHTHLERTLRRGPGSFYFNSGAWVRLIELQPDWLENDENFEPVWQALAAGSLQALDAAADPRLVQEKPAVVSIIDEGNLVRGSLNRVERGPSGIDLRPQGEVFERR